MKLFEHVPEVDTHTHTVISGHAFSTLAENTAVAKKKGMYGICLTEHGPNTPNGTPEFIPHSQRMLPDIINGIHVIVALRLTLSIIVGNLIFLTSIWLSVNLQ